MQRQPAGFPAAPGPPVRRYGSMPKSESLRILKRAGRAECWEHRERSRGKRGTYDSAMPLSFPAIEQLRYLWGGPPGLRPTPRRPVAGVKELDPSSGERVQGDPPRPGPDQGLPLEFLRHYARVCAPRRQLEPIAAGAATLMEKGLLRSPSSETTTGTCWPVTEAVSANWISRSPEPSCAC